MAGNAPSLAEKDPLRLSQAINELFQGRSHAVGTFTITPSTTTTTVTSDTSGDESAILLCPLTANAAAALATTYILATNIKNGSFIVTHANNAQTDRTFRYVAIG